MRKIHVHLRILHVLLEATERKTRSGLWVKSKKDDTPIVFPFWLLESFFEHSELPRRVKMYKDVSELIDEHGKDFDFDIEFKESTSWPGKYDMLKDGKYANSIEKDTFHKYFGQYLDAEMP